MSFSLGVDTGGTYTDAALLDAANGRVICYAKALTTYDDLSRGVRQALAAGGPTVIEVPLALLGPTDMT